MHNAISLASSRCHLLLNNSAAYRPIYHNPPDEKMVALNQCHHNTTGLTAHQHTTGRTTYHHYKFAYNIVQQHYALGYALPTHVLIDVRTPALDQSQFDFFFSSSTSWNDVSLFPECHATHKPKKPLNLAHIWGFCQYIYKLALNSPLAWDINQRIYFFMSYSHDINYLIARIIMKLQRYITRRHDFCCYWRELLICGLLKSEYMFFLVHMPLFHQLNIFIINLIMFIAKRFVKLLIFLYKNFIKTCLLIRWLYIMILNYNNKILIYLCLTLACFGKWAYICKGQTLASSAHDINAEYKFVGGGTSARYDFEMLQPYMVSRENELPNPEEFNYIYACHCSIKKAAQIIQASGEKQIMCNVPIGSIADILTMTQANEIAKEHNLHALSHKSIAEKRIIIKSHICTKSCNDCVTLFKAVNKSRKAQSSERVKKVVSQHKVGRKSWAKQKRASVNHKYYIKNNTQFPPSPPSNRLMHKIISGFCEDTHPRKFEEAGCAICGQLVTMSGLTNLADIKCSLDPLVRSGVTRLPRTSADDPIEELQGPIIDSNCQHACHECIRYLEKKVIPPTALANGLWVGQIPKELSDLTFVERLLVSHVRSNRCIVHVLKGGWKMRANAIMFPTPIPKICNILPPPIEELDEVIAFMFTGVA